MAKTEFKLIRKPKSPNIAKRIIRQEVIRTLKPVADASQKSYEAVVDNWNNKPAFKTDIKVTDKQIEIVTVVRRGQRVEGSDITTATLWKFIDTTGTKAHSIRPKRPTGVLRFSWGGPGSYQSKTGARPARYGGPGTVRNAQIVYRKHVNHPGFPPRKFSEAINKDLKGKFNNAIDSGYRSGLRKLKS